ncbi:hypothetical protein LX36DRAFT_109541 [Colletotrichum falcatum]|nr:hypothetical protein LX36DRAFT_109541 [Colletotrichum falcatum]
MGWYVFFLSWSLRRASSDGRGRGQDRRPMYHAGSRELVDTLVAQPITTHYQSHSNGCARLCEPYHCKILQTVFPGLVPVNKRPGFPRESRSRHQTPSKKPKLLSVSFNTCPKGSAPASNVSSTSSNIPHSSKLFSSKSNKAPIAMRL